jgi:thiol-disulfide isomerase/thioredoxin
LVSAQAIEKDPLICSRAFNKAAALFRQIEIKRFIGILALFLCLLQLSPARAWSDELRVGERAPNLLGSDAISGNHVNLLRVMTEMRFQRDAKGNLVMNEDGKYASEFFHFVTVLNFFSRSCIPCLREIPTFNRVAAAYRGKPVKFLYINVDPDLDADGMRRLIERHQIEVPVMMTNQNEAIRKYDAAVLPRLVAVGLDKRIAFILTGFHEDLADRLSDVIDQLLEGGVSHPD